MNLIEGLHQQMNRVRDMLPEYDAIPAGIFAATMMRHDIQQAEFAIASGDTIAMMVCYTKLEEYEY